MTTPKIIALDHLVLTVADIAQTVAFYCEVLGMQVIEFAAADGSRRWALKFGAQKMQSASGRGVVCASYSIS